MAYNLGHEICHVLGKVENIGARIDCVHADYRISIESLLDALRYFDFHFYDLDFCRIASQAGMRLGTWIVRLTHQSGGAFRSSQWLQKYQQYLNKCEGIPNKDQELQKAMGDVLQMAVEHQQDGRLEEAEILYQEILKIQPENAEANHNLGLIEAHTKDTATAVPRLERAVQAKPENEQYWVSYVDALMQSGATESAIDALELGQQYGLRTETAQAMAAEFVGEMESKGNTTEAGLSSSVAVHKNDCYITTLIPA
jgi:tetratricopeptide (TPR) repeat protein